MRENLHPCTKTWYCSYDLHTWTAACSCCSQAACSWHCGQWARRHCSGRCARRATCAR